MGNEARDEGAYGPLTSELYFCIFGKTLLQNVKFGSSLKQAMYAYFSICLVCGKILFEDWRII